MASEQVRRENVADQRNTEVEKVVVPKIRTHFESLAEKAKSPQGSPGSAEKVHQYETLPVGVGETKDEEGKKWGRERRVGERRQGPTLEEISELRGTAQQNSMEAIRAAEERYEKAKESGASALQKTKESAGQGKDNALQGIQTGSQYIADKSGALKETAVGKGQQAKEYTAQKAVEAKHSISSKGGALTDTVAGVTSSVAGYKGEKSVAAKDKVAGVGQTVVDYAGETLTAAKDAVIASQEKAAEYADTKRAEAQKDLEAKKASHQRGERGDTFETRAEREVPTEKFFHGGAEVEQMPRPGSGGVGGVFQAIGETLMEIGQTTKDLLVGQYPIRVLDQKDRGSKDRDDEPYRGTGEGI